MTVSSDGVESLYAPETGEVWLQLVTIDHDDLVTPIRIVNNTEDIVSDGQTFEACAFPSLLPGSTDGELPSVELTVDNVDRRFTDAVRSITTPFTLTVEIVRASDPDVIEGGPYVYESRTFRLTAETLRIELTTESLMTEPFPEGVITPTTNAGLFESVDR